jgi:hypothetical protein
MLDYREELSVKELHHGHSTPTVITPYQVLVLHLLHLVRVVAAMVTEARVDSLRSPIALAGWVSTRTVHSTSVTNSK